MTIRDMEALEAIRVGGTIRVVNPRIGTKVYERTSGGFRLDGVTIEPKWFAGHIAAEEVTDFQSGDPVPGDYFLSGSNGYLMLQVVNDMFHFARFRHRDGRFIDLMHRGAAEVRGYNWVRQSEVPAWHGTALSAYTLLNAERQQVDHLNEQVADYQRREADAIRARDQAARALEEATALRAAHVQVVANGVTALPLEKAAGATPNETTVLTLVAHWARQYTVITAPARGCQCGAITRASVAEYLGIQEGAEFTFTVDCGRH